MINITNFAKKNETTNTTFTTEIATSNQTIIHDIQATERQVKIYEDVKNYIETIVDTDKVIQNVPTVNSVELKNYSIQFGNNNSYIHVKDITNNFIYGSFSLGNKKLLSGDNIQYIIFNILQRVSCPNASEGCKKFCYANKSNCNVNCKNSSSRNSRVNNIVLTMFSNFDKIVNEVIEFLQKFTQRKIVFRFHESGDIYGVEYWEQIKRIMEKNSNVNFMFYTKTFFVLDEINKINQMKNVALRYSLDDTTNKHIISKVDSLNCLTFIVMDSKNTCAYSEIVGTGNTCNVKNMDMKKEVEKIEELKNQLINANKTEAKKIQIQINAINKNVIDGEKTCNKCMKCFNKSNVALFVATH